MARGGCNLLRSQLGTYALGGFKLLSLKMSSCCSVSFLCSMCCTAGTEAGAITKAGEEIKGTAVLSA